MYQSQRPPKTVIILLCFLPSFSHSLFPKKCTTSFPWKCYKNRGCSRLEKLKFWGPKRWNNSLPVFKAPIFLVQRRCCFFGIWPLSSFLLFLSLKKGVAKQTLFYRVFLPPPSLQSSIECQLAPYRSALGHFSKLARREAQTSVFAFFKISFCKSLKHPVLMGLHIGSEC